MWFIVIMQFTEILWLIDNVSVYDQFTEMSRNMKVKEDYRHLKYLLSDESLMLLPEYQQRVQVGGVTNYRLLICSNLIRLAEFERNVIRADWKIMLQ